MSPWAAPPTCAGPWPASRTRLAVFDTRLHADAWKQAYASLERVEKQLNAGGAKSRIDHWAALLAVAALEERTVLVRERMFRLLAQPEPRRTTAVAEVARAVGLLGFDEGRKVYESIMKLVIELPQDTQSVSLRAIIAGHRSIEDDEQREDADRASTRPSATPSVVPSGSRCVTSSRAKAGNGHDAGAAAVTRSCHE